MGNTGSIEYSDKFTIKRNEYKVHGYVHRIEKASKTPNTPPLILFICSQYAIECDGFSTISPHVSITDYCTTITKTSDHGKKRKKKWQFGIGNLIIDTNIDLIAQRTFKVNKCVKYGSGIVFGLREETGIWAFLTIYNSGGFYCFGEYQYLRKQKVRSNLIRFGEGDMFQFKFDTKKEEIKFKRNNEEDIVLLYSKYRSKALESKCRFAVGLYDLGNSVTITQSKIFYY